MKFNSLLFIFLLLTATSFGYDIHHTPIENYHLYIQRDTTSYIQTVDIESGKIETVKVISDHYEAPNWHKDNYLILNSKGRLKKLDIATKEISEINTGSITALNNDHGLSPDHKTLVLSNFDKSGSTLSEMISSLYLVAVEGGEPKKVSTDAICFWHGWSPDGKTLAYVGMKGDNLDVYTIPVNGGKAIRLTTAEGLDDGPEYSPDGKYIYINSYRSGHMQLWRMRADGSRPEQLTFDDYSNWFPHVSPDNKWIAYISYVKNQNQNHPFGKDVKLRLMNIETREIKDLTPVFYGGQGTINVPSWSPDSKKVAFVRYSIK
jgi:Tol biopolymer transport system component